MLGPRIRGRDRRRRAPSLRGNGCRISLFYLNRWDAGDGSEASGSPKVTRGPQRPRCSPPCVAGGAAPQHSFPYWGSQHRNTQQGKAIVVNPGRQSVPAAPRPGILSPAPLQNSSPLLCCLCDSRCCCSSTSLCRSPGLAMAPASTAKEILQRLRGTEGQQQEDRLHRAAPRRSDSDPSRH